MAEEWVGYDGGAVQDWHRAASRIRVASDVTVIPESAFELRRNLRVVDLGNVATISACAFDSCRSLERVIWSTALSVEIGHDAFYGCRRLGEVKLGNVIKIGVDAFVGCTSLKSVSIPSSVAEIEHSAFQGCNSLAEVELGEGIQRIGKEAFANCEALVEISVPSSVTDVGDMAFQNCRSLVEVEFNEGLRHIGEKAFKHCTSLTSISIPSTTSNIGNHAFDHCHRLRYAELQEGLRVIEAGAFSFCRSLERIDIPSSATVVGAVAFWNCSSLVEAMLCEGIHLIGKGAFDSCSDLQHINIPPAAFVIDYRAGSCQLMRATMPVPTENEQRLVISKWMQYRGMSQLELTEAKVNEILGLERTEDEKIECIRKWFAYYDRLDVTTMLELAIWKVNMNGNEQDAGARQASRRICGNDMNIIIPGVLPFLEV